MALGVGRPNATRGGGFIVRGLKDALARGKQVDCDKPAVCVVKAVEDAALEDLPNALNRRGLAADPAGDALWW